MLETLEQIWKNNKSYGALGNVYWAQGKIPEATEMYFKQAQKFESFAKKEEHGLGSNTTIIERLMQAGEMYRNCGRIRDALRVYRHATKIAEKIRPEFQKAGGNWFEVFYDPKNMPHQIESLEKSLTWLWNVTKKPNESITLENSELLRGIQVEYYQ